MKSRHDAYYRRTVGLDRALSRIDFSLGAVKRAFSRSLLADQMHYNEVDFARLIRDRVESRVEYPYFNSTPTTTTP